MNNSSTMITNILQTPSNENAYTAIVEVEISHENRKVKDFAIANPQSHESENPKTLLEMARDDATRMAKDKLSSISVGYKYDSYAYKSNNDYPKREEQAQSTTTKQYNHSTKNVISEKQKNLINKLAREQGKYIDELCNNHYGKSLNNLNSKEANELIQSLK